MLEKRFAGIPLNKSVHPDEAVAIGAAIQAANLNVSSEKEGTMLNGLTLMDVTSHSLGIELVGGKMSVLIPKNTTLPYSHGKAFYNNEDGQTHVVVEVFEGEDKYTANNRLLGTFQIEGLPPRARGKLEVIVHFTVNANGILNVTANAVGTDIAGGLEIKPQKGLLTEEDTERLRAEEEVRVEREQQSAELAQAIYELEAYAQWVKKEASGKVDSDLIQHQIVQLAETVLSWLRKHKSASDITKADVLTRREVLEKSLAEIV